MDGLWTLILLSLAMLVGCYLAGSIPLAISFSEEKLRLVSVFGAGLLVGTALAVIIPEGVDSLYTSYEIQKDSFQAKSIHSVSRHLNSVGELSKASQQVVAKEPSVHSVVTEPHSYTHHAHSSMHQLIGVALVFGFVFMLIIDQLSTAHSVPRAEPENGGSPVIQNRYKITATLGLVLHAAADGIALGAAASTSQAHVEMIVFLAIMLHKAPAAFGLVSFLLHDGFDRTRIRKHLAIFSLAAPVLAIVTFFCLSQQNKESLANLHATGIAMLFSAGTFLYVSTVHILPELSVMSNNQKSSSSNVSPSDSASDSSAFSSKGFNKLELFLLVSGSLLPLVLSLGHSH